MDVLNRISSPHPLVAEMIRRPVATNDNSSQPAAVKPSRKSSTDLCNKMNLSGRQKQLCRQGDGLPEILLEAIRMSATSCQQQFQHERWNCTLDHGRINILDKGGFEYYLYFNFNV